MPLLHFVNYPDIISLKNYINSIPFWTYVSVNGYTHKPTDNEDPEIFKRAYKNSAGNLEFLRRAEELVVNNLKPRIEFVPRILLPKNVPLHIKYVFSLIEGSGWKGLVFQLMDHTNSSGTLPVFQLEIRNEKLHARWCEITNGESTDTHIYPIADAVWGGSRWYEIDIYIFLTHNEENGYIIVKLDGKDAWKRLGEVTGSERGGNVSIQYGIYGNEGMKVRTQVKQLLWEIEDGCPGIL
jgi:hypothetical protein